MAAASPTGSVLGGHSRTAIPRAPLKVKQPDTYDGSKELLQQYLAQVTLYLQFSDQLPSTHDQVKIASTYLRGKAFKWMNTHVEQYELKGRNADEDTIGIVTDFDKFKQHLKKYFGDANERQTAERNLQQLSQRGSAAAYTAEFQMWALNTY